MIQAHGFLLPSARLPTRSPIRGMSSERSRDREFTVLVADHILRDEYGYMLPAVVYRDGQTDEIRRDHRSSRPGLDGSLVIAFDSALNMPHQMLVYTRPFLQ